MATINKQNDLYFPHQNKLNVLNKSGNVTHTLSFLFHLELLEISRKKSSTGKVVNIFGIILILPPENSLSASSRASVNLSLLVLSISSWFSRKTGGKKHPYLIAETPKPKRPPC